jgi:predicted lipid carrier protein YhbT
MSSDVQAIFARMAARQIEPMLRGIAGSCQFNIEDTGIWRVTAQDGALTVTPGGGDADSTVTCAADEFLRVVRGEQNLFTLFLRGEISISGNLALVLAFTRLLTQEQAAARG